MKKPLVLIIATMVGISCTVKRQSQVPKVKPDTEVWTTQINNLNANQQFNGFAVAVVTENGLVYQKGFGYADAEKKVPYTEHTLQPIASISKTVVGIALLKAQELGKLNLDDPINLYLPFPVVNPQFPSSEITIRQLATHTSSIVDNEWYLKKNYYLKEAQPKIPTRTYDDAQQFNPADSLISLSAFSENVLKADGKWSSGSFSANKPGSRYEYSNVGTDLAAYIVERATGKNFAAFTKEYIFDPLRMNASGWNFNEINFAHCATLYENPSTPLPFYECAAYPDGGLLTSISDLSRFLSELMKGYHGKGTLLSNKSYEDYFKPQLKAAHFTDRNDKNPYTEEYNCGIFIGFGHTGYIGHTGGDPGVVTMMFFHPNTNTGRILITNTSFSDKAGNDTFYAIWDKLEELGANRD